MSTFSPPIAPSYTTAVDTQIKMLTNDFGDGYAQDTPDGLNNIADTFNVVWTNISDTNAIIIRNTLKGYNGLPFTWTDPDGNTNNYTCVKMSRAFTGFRNGNFTATFNQNFSS